MSLTADTVLDCATTMPLPGAGLCHHSSMLELGQSPTLLGT